MSIEPNHSIPWTHQPSRWSWTDLLAVFVWTAGIVIFFFDVVTLQKALFYFDITEINYPYRDFLANEMKAGRFSRWFPGLYCGMPLFSESQAGYVHPLKFLLYPWMRTWQALNLDTVLSVWLTGLGTYGWLRRHVGSAGALTGAAIFGLGGFTWSHLIHTSMNNALTSVPFAVWAVECAWAGGGLRAIALGGFALACQVFAGHLQDTLFTAGLIGLYGTYRAVIEKTPKQRAAALGAALLLIGLGVAISAIQWVPSKELLDRSPRAGGLTWDKLTFGSWSPELLPTLVVREAYGTRARDTDWMDGFYPWQEMDAYLGLIALGLAVIGAGAYRDRWVGFWVIITALGSVLMLGKFTALFDHMHRIPIIGSSRIPVRLHLWVSLAVAALAGVGVDRLGREGVVKLRGAFALGFSLILCSLPIFVYIYLPALTQSNRWPLPYHVARFSWLGRELITASIRTTLLVGLAISVAGLITKTKDIIKRSRLIAIFPLLIMLDLFGAHYQDVPTVDPGYWTNPPESALLIKADPELGRVYTRAEKSSGEPGYASEPVDFLSVRDPLGWSLPPVWGIRSSSGETPIVSKRLLDFESQAGRAGGLLDVEGVTHIVLGRPQAGIPGKYERVGAASIYKLPTTLPRVRFTSKVIFANDEQDSLQKITKLGQGIVDTTVIEAPPRQLSGQSIPAKVRIVRDLPEDIQIDVESESDGYLVLADTFDPGWSAIMEGEPVEIYPANHAFRAVYVPKGNHGVVFHYRPAGFFRALPVTNLAIITFVIFLLWPRPLFELGPEHGDSGWPKQWPILMGLAIVLLLICSIVSFNNGKLGIQSRWSNTFHPFTWGAGIEAMTRG